MFADSNSISVCIWFCLHCLTTVDLDNLGTHCKACNSTELVILTEDEAAEMAQLAAEVR